jgi:hypothetical protein
VTQLVALFRKVRRRSAGHCCGDPGAVSAHDYDNPRSRGSTARDDNDGRAVLVDAPC